MTPGLQFLGSIPGIGLIGDGVLGGPATILLPGADVPPEGFQPRCEAPPQATVIDFDDVAPGTDVREHYSELGVHFTAGDQVLGATFEARDLPVAPFDAATIGTITPANAVQFPNDPSRRSHEALHIRFDSPQRLIGVHVGDPQDVGHEIRLVIPGRETGTFPNPNMDLVQFYGSTITNCMMILLPEDAPASEVVIRTSYETQGLYVDRVFFSDDPTYSLPAVTEGRVSLAEPRGPDVEVSAPITLTGYAAPNTRPGDTAFRQVDRVLVTYRDDGGAVNNRYAEVLPPTRAGGSSSWRLEGVRLPTGPIRISLFASGTGVVARATAERTGFTTEGRRREVEGTFDLQPIGLEVTQGVRGQISPMTPGATARETAVHVAGKATTFRAYGRVVWGSGAAPSGVTSIPTDAWLFGFSRGRLLPGGPLRAYNPMVELSAGEPDLVRSLARMRARADLTWNFELPLSWTAAGSIDLMLWINPPGTRHWGEGGPDASSNGLWLRGIPFQAIDARDVIMYSADFYWRRDAPAVHAQPTLAEIGESLGYLEQAFPLPYGGVNLTEFHLKRWSLRACNGTTLVDPVRNVCSRPAVEGIPEWDNAIIVAEQAEALARVGQLFMPLLFSPASPIGCGGTASIGGSPLFHAGACGPTVAQEAAHSLGLIHLSSAHREQAPSRNRGTGDHGGLEPEAIGWDVARRQPILPALADGTHVHDIMSYGGGSKWFSIDTWDRIAAALKANNPTSPTDGPAISAGGAPIPTGSPGATGFAGWGDLALAANSQGIGTSSLLVSGRAPDGEPIVITSLIAVAAPPPATDADSEIDVVVLDASGTQLLIKKAFRLGAHGSPDGFHAFLPVLADATTIQVRQYGVALATIAIADAVPLAELTSGDAPTDLSPIVRSPFGSGGILTPGRSLRFDVMVPGAGPATTYTWRLDGAAIDDLEVTGGSASVFVAALGPGRHTLEVEVTDGSRTGRTSIAITADRDVDADGLGDTWEASVELSALDAADAASDPDRDGLAAWQEQDAGSDPRSLDTDRDGYADGVEVAGGSNPADATSLPQALHGATDLAVPMIAAGETGPPWALLVGAAAGAIALFAALAWWLRRPGRRKVPGSPV